MIPRSLLQETFADRRVLVTGHTGFKGSWLCHWLSRLGARVTGFALSPSTAPALFDQLGLASRLRHVEGDVRDAEAVRRVVDEADPEILFHLAAQPLVRASYEAPVETYQVNVLGTVHVLEALRKRNRPCVAVIVTTDKCYENLEWEHAYRESDPLGGHDPYSSSKACAELVTQAYRRSFFSLPGAAVLVASARAGNVIGGGDWSRDRLVPDAMRSLSRGEAIPVRNPSSIRPWQHVLEPVGAYLTLAARLFRAAETGDRDEAGRLATAFNFGPDASSNQPVSRVVEEIVKSWPGTWKDGRRPGEPHEAGRLTLARDKAFDRLGWRPVWDFPLTLSRTVAWYREAALSGADPVALADLDIDAYTEASARFPTPFPTS